MFKTRSDVCHIKTIHELFVDVNGKLKREKQQGGRGMAGNIFKKKLQKERPLRLQKLFLPTIPYDRINENNI